MTTCSTTECGTGLGSVILPSDPSNNSTLSATPAFGGIDVSWSMPTTNPFAVAYVNLYRGVLNDPDAALLIAAAAGNRYYDKSPNSMSIQYYYWIRFVSINGTVGELIGPASAVARPTIDVVIEQLSEKIDYGTLGTALKAKIDDIGLNYQTLLNEVANREAGEVAFSQTLALVQTTVDNALLYIGQEITARQDGDSAIAQQVNTVATVSANNLATVQQTLQATIGELGALYTVKVGVNGLVGGFGVYNDGTEVEAGFDVDTFWVGRTQANKRKPFIIVDGVVYMDQAVIRELTFTKLRDEAGSVMVVDGKIQGAYLKVSQLDLVGSNNFKVKSANTGARMEMDNQVIKVYDASGTLRVKLGNLAA